MDDDKDSRSQSGGVRISGTAKVTVGGNIVGRDMTIIHGGEISSAQLNEVFRPLHDAVHAAAPEKQPEAAVKVAALKNEVAKAAKADDGVMAKLIDGIVSLIPGAVSAIGGAFGTPLLSGIAGPVTKFVLEKCRLGN